LIHHLNFPVCTVAYWISRILLIIQTADFDSNDAFNNEQQAR